MTGTFALLRKDWRVYRPAVVGGAILAAAPYALFFTLQRVFQPDGAPADTAKAYVDIALTAAHVGLMLTVLMGAVFGGAAFAAERRERSAIFLAMVPVKRWRIAASKAVVAVACLAAMWAAHVGVMLLAIRIYGVNAAGGTRWVDTLFEPTGVNLSYLALAFGLAWLLSAILDNAAVAASIAIAVGLVWFIGVATGFEALTGGRPFMLDRLKSYEWAFAYGSTLGVGAIAFAAGVGCYVRRVSP